MDDELTLCVCGDSYDEHDTDLWVAPCEVEGCDCPGFTPEREGDE